jgi:exodeoxyribonuclease V gamma subunit
MPMRAVPFRVVCLLGMNDGDYPRRSPRADFDLLREPGLSRPGDRSRNDDDRYLMLEALLAARDKLYISWAGRNIRDNGDQPPSLLVSQLRGYLHAGWEITPGSLTIEHPLQPFSRRYFEQGGLTTYAREWRAAHGELAEHSDELPAYQLDPEFRLSLRELHDFLRNPAKYFFRRRLGVLFSDQLVTAADDEPFGLSALDEYQLVDTLLASVVGLDGDAGLDMVAARLEERTARLAQAGHLPIGRIGARWQNELVQRLTPVCHAWLGLLSRYPQPADKRPLLFAHGDVWVEDWLDRLRSNELGATAWLDCTAGKLLTNKGTPRADKLIQGWLRQLLAASQGFTVSGLMVGRDAVLELAPLERDESRHFLRELLQAWRAGMDRPLPTACLTGLALLREEDPAAVYDGNLLIRGEGQEPCLARLWPEFAALEAEQEWEHWSRLLYTPLMQWLDAAVQIHELAGITEASA